MIFLHFFFLNALAQPAFLYKEKNGWSKFAVFYDNGATL